MIYPILITLLAGVGVSNLAWAQSQSLLLFSLNQLSGKTYCFDRDPGLPENDPRQLIRQSDRDAIRVALGSSGMAEAVSGACDYRVRYSILLDQFQDIQMQPIGMGPGPYWGGYPYGPGGYPGWGAAGAVTWVPVVVTREKMQLELDMFLNQHPGVQVYQGKSSVILSGQDQRMMIPDLARRIMSHFPANNLLLMGSAR